MELRKQQLNHGDQYFRPARMSCCGLRNNGPTPLFIQVTLFLKRLEKAAGFVVDLSMMLLEWFSKAFKAV